MSSKGWRGAKLTPEEFLALKERSRKKLDELTLESFEKYKMSLRLAKRLHEVGVVMGAEQIIAMNLGEDEAEAMEKFFTDALGDQEEKKT